MPTWIGCVAHVAVDPETKKVTVKKIWQSIDCGTVVHPDGAMAQAEGATLWGVSLALHEGATFAEGTFVLNDEPIAFYAGAGGAGQQRLLLDPSEGRPFKRGKNVLRFAPNVGQTGAAKDVGARTTLYECVEAITASATWSFAKWEPPTAGSFAACTAPQAAKLKGRPAWWRCSFDSPKHDEPLWFDTTGLSKGQVYLNDRNVGRYFTATATGKAVGPQKRLYLPGEWLAETGANEILIFDEHGFAPQKTKVVVSAAGDLD